MSHRRGLYPVHEGHIIRQIQQAISDIMETYNLQCKRIPSDDIYASFRLVKRNMPESTFSILSEEVFIDLMDGGNVNK